MEGKTNGKKKYEALRDDLIAYINKNNLQKNDKLPTVRDIIKDLGYSYATVNRTLNDMENEGLITKRQGRGLFVNRTVPQVHTKEVSLIIPKNFSDHKIFIDILTGIQNEVEKAGISLMVSISNMSHEKEKETVFKLISKKIDGLIIFLENNYINDYSHIVELKEKKIPFVLVDRYIPELDTDYVVINNADGIFKICSYLKYNRSCNRIILIPPGSSANKVSSTNEKITGYKNAMRVLYGDESYEMMMNLEELVEKLPDLCSEYKNLGVCLNHDEMYPELVSLLSKRNHSIPENCHVFGYNNNFETPLCPTVEQFNNQVGAKAARILINKLNNPDLPTEHIRIEPKLILPDGSGGYYMEN